MATQREPGSNIIAQYTTPLRGTWNSLAIHAIPLDALYDSQNVFLRRGKLRNRPGMQAVTNVLFDGTVLGATLATTPYDKIVLAVTKSSVYELRENSDVWAIAANHTNIKYALSDTSAVDIALLETSGRYVALLAERSHVLQQWDGLAHATGEIVSSFEFSTVPAPASVCIAARRVIALTPPHTIQWSATFDHTNWSPLAIYRLAQTGDEGICVRALSSLSFAVYKDRSIYVARAQAGNDDTAFNFAEPIRVEGPAGVHAVVDVSGMHIYMTRSGRVAAFDGTRFPAWIADGLWLFLQDDIDPVFAHMIFGVYDYRLHMIKFVYPKRGDNGKLRGLVLINVPFEGLDIAEATQKVYASFKGTLGISCTMGCEMRFNRLINRSLLFSDDGFTKTSFILSEDVELDNDVSFPCSIQLPMQALQEAQHAQVQVETLVERGKHYGSIIIEGVTSNFLETETGTIDIAKAQVIDLERDPVVDVKAFNVPTRFFGVKYRWDSTSNVRYAGAVVYARKA
jgi:hypothetical protein